MLSEKECQTNMDQRLSRLENHTRSIHDNIAAMMAHWQITRHRVVSVMHSQDHTISQAMPLEEDGGAPCDANSDIMDLGEMEE